MGEHNNLYDKWRKRVDGILDGVDDGNHTWGEIKVPIITIDDVVKNFKPEELINAIGIEKVETILRAHKINKIKNKIN